MKQRGLVLLKRIQVKRYSFTPQKLVHNIKEGYEVTIEVSEGKKGINAVDVRIAL